MLNRDEVEAFVRETAKMICDEQPEVPEPHSLRDLDSFSLVQVVLELENHYEIKILERLEGFTGETFGDLANFIVYWEHKQATGQPAGQPATGPAAQPAGEQPSPSGSTV
jgi:acyl carrier protein